MNKLRLAAGLLFGVALLAAVLLALSLLPPSQPPVPDRELEPLQPLPAPEEPLQPPVPVPDVGEVAPVLEAASAVDEPVAEPSEVEAVEPPALPPLDESDAFVRQQTSPACLPLAWLAADNLVRRAAVLVENASRGELPPKRGGLLPPLDAFPVRQEGERFFMNESGYPRFDPYLDQLEAIDPERLAGCIRLLEPLLDQALNELGHSDGPQAGIVAVFDRILAVPGPIEGADVELVQPKVLFRYADPRLESLSGLQKQMLRMGPENTRRLKAYVTRLQPLLADAPLN
ncbi:MAG: DUF3014 domain-containing protein [Gammaproteobacteria bacterium]|nr:DUF3014 domain-containing protein [Gammaproteobacteria bacterium]MYH15130.1 DUF3014 domain-containing protein [Gammaproteobacteria bacterium]MYK83899.1 DUF3014 domain-containing protein [Gammaproteobacteria bacterium]